MLRPLHAEVIRGRWLRSPVRVAALANAFQPVCSELSARLHGEVMAAPLGWRGGTVVTR